MSLKSNSMHYSHTLQGGLWGDRLAKKLTSEPLKGEILNVERKSEKAIL